jgi:photosystem II stability/assembly factor-like uncharacterized protein
MKKSVLFIAILMSLTSLNYSQWNVLPISTSQYLMDVFFINPDTGWVVGYNSTIYKTTNGGNSWNQLQVPITQNLISVYFVDENIGWVTGSQGGIIKTTDGGSTWANQNSGVPYQIESICFTNSDNGYAVVNDWFGWRYGAILQTTNGGQNWIIKTQFDQFGMIDIHFPTSAAGYAVGSNGLIWKTTDAGNSWNYMFFSDIWLHSVFFINDRVGWIAGGSLSSDFIIKTTNNGNSWFVVRQTNQNALLSGIYFIDEENGWACGDGGTILRTRDGGGSWTKETTNIQNHLQEFSFANNQGYSVGNIGTVLKFDIDFQYPLTLIRPNGGEIFYTGTQENIYWIWSDTSNVTIEYSYGTGWNLIAENIPNTGEYLWTVPAVNSNSVLMKISKSDDSGVFSISNHPFSIRPFIPVELVSFNADVWSGNVALSWSTASEVNNFGFEIQRSIDNTDFLTIGFVNGYGTTTELNDYTYTDQNVTPGKYYYRLKQVDFDGTFEYSNIVEAEVVGPVDFSLNQNYPNPFNPSTVISFSIPVSDYVTIKIYDMLGNEVGVIVNEELPAGTHKAEFEIEGLSSGTYFYRMQAGSFVQSKKMTLIK